MEKILVTGGLGFIGSNLIKLLLKKKYTVLNVDKIKSLGWEPKINLREGIESTYEWYKNSISKK